MRWGILTKASFAIAMTACATPRHTRASPTAESQSIATVVQPAIADAGAATVEAGPGSSVSQRGRDCKEPSTIELAGTDVTVVVSARHDAEGHPKVCEIRSGKTRLYPYDCTEPAMAAICGDDGKELRERGLDLTLVASDDRGSRHRVLLSAECANNTMCGSFGFWLLTATPHGVLVSPPVAGCFGAPGGRMDWASLRFAPPMTIDARTPRPKTYDATRNRWQDR